MIFRHFKLRNLITVIIFFPVIFYFGHRSYIAYDEGFYVLQARWILEKGNWIIPLWWDEYILDRTIGIQFLIAKSQEIFGQTTFSVYLPTTIAAIIMLFTTYKLHEELLDKKYAIISPLILSTTYLWFDYSHLATQDIVYSCLVTIGILSLVKIKSNENRFYIFLFGIWIGLAFMMKTFLVFVPLLALAPYLFTKKYIFFEKFFWIGFLFGLLPFLLWIYNINQYLDKNIFIYLFDKVNRLSNKNNFTNPFYYYFWNIPITFLPWSIFSIFGLMRITFINQNEKFILGYFPLIFIFFISIFSTKTPYYPLQISSILSLNAYIGISYLYNSKNYKSFFIFITSKLIPSFIILIIFIYIIFFKSSLNFNFKENILLIAALSSFGIAWSFINNKKDIKEIFAILVLGPYLLTSLLLQSGLFTDRSREIRETMQYLYSLDIPKDQLIKVDKSNIWGEEAQSKIIKIALQTPNLGDVFNSSEEIQPLDLAWTTLSKKEINRDNSFQIIFDDANLYPWKLVKKNY